MEFYDVVGQILELLQRQKRVSYRALKRQFSIDDDYIEDLQEEFLYAHESLVQVDDRGLTWVIVEPTQTVPETSPPTEPHTPDAERRQLTVMFCDLVGSTELSGQFDPEDYRDLVRHYQTTCGEVIERFGCHLAQTLGDGLLIYSGYPIAHENDAERAVRVALGILDAMTNLNGRLEQERGIRLGVRVGIHTGQVVVGEVGAGSRQEQLALGEVPNVASRIQSLASPDMVVISEATSRLVQGFFDVETLGEHELRGVAQPMAVYRILRESGAQSRLDVAKPQGLTPLVGRESESALLFERWEQAKAGQGQVILLSGEAGIGKSRLIQVLKDHIVNERHTRIECRSSPYFTNSALYPITDFLQRMLRFQAEDTPEQKLEKLTQNLSQFRLPLDESVLLHGALLSLPLPEDQYPPLHLSPQRQRQKTLEAIVAIILELAEHQPVLFILEDLHWTDPTTLEFLQLLIDQTPTASVYALLTSRPEFQPDWSHRSYLSELSLNRLSHTLIEQVMTQVAGGKMLPHEVIAQLVDRADGVPLYVEEMIKAVLESGVLKEMDDHYELMGSISSLSIPATLQDSLMARLDRLVTAKGVAQYASVLGRQFSYELLQAVSQLDESILQHELGRLVEVEIVYQRGLPPQAVYTFKHALIQDIAYESLLRSTRQGYHRRTAEVLVDQFPEIAETQPELVAHHYTEAGQAEQAIPYWQRAGERAHERSAYQEAISHLMTGLTLLETLPETLARHQKELPLQTALGTVLRIPKGFAAPEVVDVFTRARILCQQLRDSQDVLPVLYGLWRLYNFQANFPMARQVSEELLDLAERGDDASLNILSHYTMGATYLWMGDLQLAHCHLEKSLAHFNRSQQRDLMFGASQDLPRISCRAHNAIALWLLGYPDQARERVHDALVLAHELGPPFGKAVAQSMASIVYQFCREPQDVHDHAEAAVTLSTEQGFPVWLTISTILQGWALASGGKREEGLMQMRLGLTDYRASGSKVNTAYFLSLIGEVYGNLNQAEVGLGTLSEGVSAIERTGENWYKSEIYHIKGQLLLQQTLDNATEAGACFKQAISIAQSQQAKSWELRASTSLAKLWQFQGKRQEAHDLLEPVYAWFTEGFDTADLIDAKALLDELAE